MKRWIAVCGLVGCYDFGGDAGKVGFRTQLLVDGAPWTPAARVAAGTPIDVVAAGPLDGQERDLAVSPRVSGDLAITEDRGNTFRVTGRRGAVRVDGELADHFHVRTAAPERVHRRHAALDTPVQRVAAGATPELYLSLRDGRGRALGHDPASLVIDGEGATYLGRPVALDPIVTVDAADLVAVELRPFRLDQLWAELCGVVAVGRTGDGEPVFGPPVTWTLSGPAQQPMPDVVTWPCDAPVDARAALAGR